MNHFLIRSCPLLMANDFLTHGYCARTVCDLLHFEASTFTVSLCRAISWLSAADTAKACGVSNGRSGLCSTIRRMNT